MSADEQTRQGVGKIARLPLKLRERVNAMLLENRPAREIVEMINAEAKLNGEDAVSAQNLSNWKAGGYTQWVKKRERLERTRELSALALEIGKAAVGGVSEASAAIAGGKVLELIELAAGDVDELEPLIEMLSHLRQGDAAVQRVQVARQAQELRKRELTLTEKQMQLRTAEQFMKWARSAEAQAILNRKTGREVKLQELCKLMFGEAPEVDRAT